MVIFWMVFEIICVGMGLPAGGYMMLQFSMLNRYEDILVDIGEEKWEKRGGEKQKRGTVADIVWGSLIMGVGFVLCKFLLQGFGEENAQKISNKLINMLVGDEQLDNSTVFRLTGVADVFKQVRGIMNGDFTGLMNWL